MSAIDVKFKARIECSKPVHDYRRHCNTSAVFEVDSDAMTEAEFRILAANHFKKLGWQIHNTRCPECMKHYDLM